MIKPLISSWIGRGNFGDELLAYGLRLELYKTSRVCSISYLEKGKYDIFKAENDVHIKRVNRVGASPIEKFHAQYLQRYSFYNLLMFGGGSIFHSSNSIKWKHQILRRFRARRPRGQQVRIGCMGVSLGPFDTSETKAAAVNYINELDFLHCRDKPSIEFARDHARSVTILEGRDLAFSVRAIQPEYFKYPKIEGRVGVSFLLDRTLPGEQQEKTLVKMLAVVNRLTNYGLSVALISLYCGDEFQDQVTHKKIYRNANNPNKITLHHYQGDVIATLKEIASCDSYISMRLHGIIAAFLSGTPSLAIHDHKKIIDFSSEFHVTDKPIGIANTELTIDELIERIDIFLQNKLNRNSYCADDDVYKLSSKALVNIFNENI